MDGTGAALHRRIFRLGDRSPMPRRVADVDAIPIIDAPLPDKLCEHPRFLAPGTGPWQRKARAMNVGQSIVVTPEQADSFRGACRRLGIQVRCATLPDGKRQVQIVSKPASC